MKQLRSLHNNGMTLIEVLVTLGIIMMISGLVFSIGSDTFSYNRKASASLTSVDRAQRLLQPMAAEIRSASMSVLGSFPVAQASDYDFAFYSDIDNDGRPDYVRYYLDGTTLYKQVIHPQVALPPVYAPQDAVTTSFIEGVQNQSRGIPVFRYFSNQYTSEGVSEIADASTAVESVRMVRVSLALSSGTSTDFSVESDITIRNLKQQ